ncbi:AP-3 complex subunit sigma-1 [Capsicum annuum]|nr:AP-3 complex subunit sigma-1 [Capsicum annuum]
MPVLLWRYTKKNDKSVLSGRPDNVSNFIRSLGTVFGPPVWMVVCHGFIMYGTVWYGTVCYVELIDPPPSSTSHRPRRGRPRKIPIPISILPENSNPENGKTLKRVNGVAASLISSVDTTMLNARVVPEMDAVVKKRVKLKKRVYKDTRLVYKHYATLYFVFLFDNSENELAMLDLIQALVDDVILVISVFVETLDKCFKSVCELDVVFNYSKMHTILDEIILGGQVLETDSVEVMRAVEEISKLESTTSAGTMINKSIPSWWAR